MKKKQIKVLHVLSSNIFSGAENVACMIINAFKNEIDMAYCSPFGNIEKTLNEQDIKYYKTSKNNLKELNEIIKEYRPDIIHAHDYGASCLVAISRFKGKIISHIHNNSPFAKYWNIRTFLYAVLSYKFDKVICVSNKVVEEAIYKNKIKDKFEVLYNYVDEEKIKKMAKEFKIAKDYDLFFIGRLTDPKNPIEFIKIVNAINKVKKVKAVIIGDGELKELCQLTIKRYNLEKTIDMVGFQSNPFPYIRASKIGIMPSKWEGFGLTAIEATILNKPVLNSGAGGLKEIFTESDYICDTINDYVKIVLEKLKNRNQNIKSIRLVEKATWKNKILNVYGLKDIVLNKK